ncbi:hypothetical protein ACFP8W_17990, partial [Nocardioides hankookensis]
MPTPTGSSTSTRPRSTPRSGTPTGCSSTSSPGSRATARVVSEQNLRDRVPAELVDYRRIEAAINVLFADTPVDVLCPYDATLPADLLEIGHDTHDATLGTGPVAHSLWAEDPMGLLTELAKVEAPPRGATTLDCSSPSEVAHARRLVH